MFIEILLFTYVCYLLLLNWCLHSTASFSASHIEMQIESVIAALLCVVCCVLLMISFQSTSKRFLHVAILLPCAGKPNSFFWTCCKFKISKWMKLDLVLKLCMCLITYFWYFQFLAYFKRYTLTIKQIYIYFKKKKDNSKYNFTKYIFI